MSYKPPLSKAEKVSITCNDINQSNGGNIAAIDFGTTSVSLAYTTKGDEKINTFLLDADEKSARVPNAFFLERDENRKISVIAFGSNARNRFSAIKHSITQDFIYFERIKMLMKRSKNINRQALVRSFSGEKFYLLEVIAFILQYVKDQLIDHLAIGAKPLKTTDFDWVITVPAIWDARGKRMMREAAYLGGLLTESSNGITHFSQISDISYPIPDEINPEKLSLALEPESAAIYSQENIIEQIEGDPSTAAVKRPTKYMVIDIGGGTVDITTHFEVDGGIVVQNIPTGNAWGGTEVNKAFSKLLESELNDPSFQNFLQHGNYSQQKAILNKMFYIEFENQKVLFGKELINEILITLPKKFVKFFQNELAKGINGMEYDDDMDTLWVSNEVIESKLFGPAVDGIIESTLSAIEDSEHKVDTFYLVGGFGGCKYIHRKVSAAIKNAYSSKGHDVHVVVPLTPHLAVATGAVMWHQNKGKVKGRCVDATYGIGTSIPFNPEQHDEHYRYYDSAWEHDRCRDVFDVFIEKGELAKIDEVITLDLCPFSQDDTDVHISIYCTTEPGVQYVKDKEGKKAVTKIGKLVIDVPNPDNLPLHERLVDVSMDFSGTEIKAKAKYRINGKEVKTVCDFLSIH